MKAYAFSLSIKSFLIDNAVFSRNLCAIEKLGVKKAKIKK